MKQRVLVLGGGCAGVAAAWALSRTDELRQRFDVTVVQHGHRLGGKGATGRDPTRGDAILEHGLHLWLGFYQEAFAMMRDIYEHWDKPASGPQSSIESAFAPLRDITLMGGSNDSPDYWHMRFPQLPGRPWDAPSTSSIRWLHVIRSWAAGIKEALVNDANARWTTERLRLVTGLSAAIVKGLTLELSRHGERCWDVMDQLDLRAWLQANGASAAAADAPPVRALYDLGFAYPDGIAGPHRGAMAAGAGLRALLQIFGGYRGAPFWRMTAGMGDTVFAPAYEVLRQRGVNFRFFHRVDSLRLQGRSVERVELGVQAHIKGDAYNPLVQIGTVRAWPAQPKLNQLQSIVDDDLEGDRGGSLEACELVRGVDFDHVVLAIPSTAHRHFAAELIAANPAYRRMVEHTNAVPTIAGQWWLARSHNQLGWNGPAPVVTGLPGLFRTWADMSEVIDAENWATRPNGLAYFCNVAPPQLHNTYDPHTAAQTVHEQMQAWAKNLSTTIWPNTRAIGGNHFDTGALHSDRLRQPWAVQYARANVRQWERYVLSLPGSMQHRLAPHQSGFDNVWLAGDWTRNAINGGSVEGAVSSGLMAAQGISEMPPR